MEMSRNKCVYAEVVTMMCRIYYTDVYIQGNDTNRVSRGKEIKISRPPGKYVELAMGRLIRGRSASRVRCPSPLELEVQVFGAWERQNGGR